MHVKRKITGLALSLILASSIGLTALAAETSTEFSADDGSNHIVATATLHVNWNIGDDSGYASTHKVSGSNFPKFGVSIIAYNTAGNAIAGDADASELGGAFASVGNINAAEMSSYHTIQNNSGTPLSARDLSLEN